MLDHGDRMIEDGRDELGREHLPGESSTVFDGYDDQKLLGGGPRTGAALRELVLDLQPKLANKG